MPRVTLRGYDYVAEILNRYSRNLSDIGLRKYLSVECFTVAVKKDYRNKERREEKGISRVQNSRFVLLSSSISS